MLFRSSGLNVNTGASDIYITSLGANVQRKYLNDSYSYGNVFSFDIEGVVYNPFSTENLQINLYNKIRDIANSGKYNYRIKSLNFPNSAGEISEGIRFLKFNATAEFNENIDNSNEDFLLYTGQITDNEKNFFGGFTGIQNHGSELKEYSENFNFDENDDNDLSFDVIEKYTELAEEDLDPQIAVNDID